MSEDGVRPWGGKCVGTLGGKGRDTIRGGTGTDDCRGGQVVTGC
jgi:hypothetical protein